MKSKNSSKSSSASNSDSRSSARKRRSPIAVIDIGATSVRMAIAEIVKEGETKLLETLSQSVSLGKDVFITGEIQTTTVEDCVRVLNIYRDKLSEYQINKSSSIRIVATSAVREAKNRLAFLDRIYIATGFEVEPFDEAELHRVTYLGIEPILQDPEIAGADQLLVCEVGGGSTESIVISDGAVSFATTFRLGALRLSRTLEAFHTPTRRMRTVMERQISRTAEQLSKEIDRDRNIQLVAMGGDVRFAATQLTGAWSPDELATINVSDLENLIDRLMVIEPDVLVQDYHLNFNEAETVAPALLIYLQIAKALNIQEIQVASGNLRDGLLKEMAASEEWTNEFSNQIIRAAVNLGRKFHYDEDHAEHVAMLCRQLFRETTALHGLDRRYELLLYIGALLHEIGGYVNQRSLHKHSMYVIRNSGLFGLGRRDLLLVSLVARYHRRASPQPTHEGYTELNREGRVAISKMACLLRIAKALDESRTQRIKELRCRITSKQVVIEVPRIDDLSLEQIAIQQSTRMFAEIFGKPVLLRSIQR